LSWGKSPETYRRNRFLLLSSLLLIFFLCMFNGVCGSADLSFSYGFFAAAYA
jgi:hypothetical protein